MGAVLFRVVLPVSDFERAVAYYADLLDLPGRRAARGRHWFDCGGLTLAVVDPRGAGDGQDVRPNQEALYFAVDDLEAAYARARAALRAGGCVESEIAARPWGERSFFVTDPWGNRLCFVQAGTEFRGY